MAKNTLVPCAVSIEFVSGPLDREIYSKESELLEA